MNLMRGIQDGSAWRNFDRQPINRSVNNLSHGSFFSMPAGQAVRTSELQKIRKAVV
jgi:hypothetical protein